MSRESFLESIKVAQEIIDQCNDVSKQANEKANANPAPRGGAEDGGHEIADSGPASQGRESGYKWGEAPTTESTATEGQNEGSQNGETSAVSAMGNSSEGNAVSGSESGSSFGGESGVSAGCVGGNGYGCGM